MLTSLLVSGGKSYTIPLWNMKTMKSFEHAHLFWEWDDLILDGRSGLSFTEGSFCKYAS